jgi:hypothetical protein
MELASLVSGVIKEDPKSCDFLPLNQVYLDGVRQNDKRPAWIKFASPDGWVVNLSKNEKLMDAFVIMRIERRFVEQWMSDRNKERSDESKQSGNEGHDGSISSEAGKSGLPE